MTTMPSDPKEDPQIIEPGEVGPEGPFDPEVAPEPDGEPAVDGDTSAAPGPDLDPQTNMSQPDPLLDKG